MKNFCKLFLFLLPLVFICNTSFAGNMLKSKADNSFYPTQANMLNESSKNIEFSDSSFEKICNNIVKNFKSDKNFVTAFNEDKTEFLKYRLLQRDLILPARKSDNTAYGSNYGIHSHSYLMELNRDKINSYKRSVQLYCLYNEKCQSRQACSEKKIKEIFNY